MRSVELSAQSRSERGKGPARRLRSAGRIPAVLYGENEAATSISLDGHELSRLLHGEGENFIVNLVVDSNPAILTLLKDTQHDAMSGRVKHVDFLRVSENKPVTTRVVVHPVGTSQGQRAGGVFEQHLREVDIQCLPRLIPEMLEFDITAMEIGDTFHVAQLSVPEGVKILTPEDHPVAAVLAASKMAMEEEAKEAAEEAEAEAKAAPEADKASES